jgi:hypothetical protein
MKQSLQLRIEMLNEESLISFKRLENLEKINTFKVRLYHLDYYKSIFHSMSKAKIPFMY